MDANCIFKIFEKQKSCSQEKQLSRFEHPLFVILLSQSGRSLSIQFHDSFYTHINAGVSAPLPKNEETFIITVHMQIFLHC